MIIFFGTSLASLRSPLSWVSALYWYYKNTVFRFVWYCLVFVQWSYYCDFVCFSPASRLCNIHRHVWVRYIHTTTITVAGMSLLLLSIELRQICYLIMFYFKLTNVAIEKFCMVKWCNAGINNRTGHFFLANFESVYLFYFWTQMFFW